MRNSALMLAAWAILCLAAPAPAQGGKVTLHTRVAGAFKDAAADARRLAVALTAKGSPADDLHAVRYFWFSTREPVKLANAKLAFQLHVNFLSRYSVPIRLDFVAPDLCRLDVDLPQWDRATLEAAAHVDVFFHERQQLEEPATFEFYWPGGVDSRLGKKFRKQSYRQQFAAGDVVPLSARWLDPADALALRKLLFTEVPVLNAEWFLVQSCKQISLRNSDREGLGYYDFLRLKDRDDFFRLIAFDVKAAARLGKKLKAAQEFSKVSALGRQVDADSSQSGGVWVTLDPVDATNDGVVIRQLKDGTLNHKIEEWYGALANGLPATFLSNDRGVRANNAPADAVGLGDCSHLNEGNDRRIHIHLACIRCHEGAVLKPIRDWVRETYGNNPLALGDPDKKAAQDLQKQYFGDLDDKLATDVIAYKKAFRRATVTAEYPRGVDAQRAVEIYCRLYHDYADRPVTLAEAAEGLGVDRETLSRRLNWLVTEVKLLDLRLAPLVRLGAKEPLPVQRLTFEDSYELLQDVVHGVVPKLRKPVTKRATK